MGKRKGISPVLVAVLLALVLPYTVSSRGFFEFGEDGHNSSNSTPSHNDTPNLTELDLTCVFGLEPCSISILGNIQLVLFFGIILGVSAKVISDGAEMLLDLGLPPTIIGGIVLPLLGAVPDSAMIIASGAGSKGDADTQIAVGMGTLAGSTIMLLTIPWVGGLILGRVDIVNGQGVDGKCSKLKPSSLWKSGVTVTPDVTYSAIIMLVTALPYLIIQGADWYYGPTTEQDITNVPNYIKYTAISTCVICLIFFVGYLAYLVIFSAASKRRDELRRQEKLKRKVLKQMILSFQGTKKVQRDDPEASTGSGGASAEKKPLLGHSETGLQKKYFSAWKVHRKPSVSPENPPDETDTKSEHEEEEEVEEPKWKIAIKSATFLIVGVGLVTVFSDPMVDALTRLVDPTNHDFGYIKDGHVVRGQYIPIPVFYLSFVITPLCSNASELVSSLIFASKKKKVNTSMTFSQLYGAATMNNTLCLGIFTALVGFRGLTWQYSAEVTVIFLVQVIMGAIALCYGFLYKHTYQLLLIFPVFVLYFGSILLTWMLEHFLHWK